MAGIGESEEEVSESPRNGITSKHKVKYHLTFQCGCVTPGLLGLISSFKAARQ